jgi:hypothetical protein
MKELLKEVIANAIEVAEAAKDDELKESYERMTKLVNQSHYRKLNLEDTQVLWHLADVGERTCDMLLETAETPEHFERTNEVKDIYERIKLEIEDSIDREREKKLKNMQFR